MERKEIARILERYILKPNGTRFFSIYGEICEVDNSFLQQLMNCKEILWFDAPDGFLKIGKKGIMCEHFTIDVSKTTKNKGSFIKRETQGNSKNFNLINFIKNINNENDIREKADKLAHINHLKNNFRMIYLDHFKEIKNYEKNILNSGELNLPQKLEMAFFVEDTTPYDAIFSPIVKTKEILIKDLHNKVLQNIRLCIDEIKNKLVDYIFYCFDLANKPYIVYISKRMIIKQSNH